MQHVIIGFYKQAEEYGLAPETTHAMLAQLNKAAEAAYEYVEYAAKESGNPALFKQALAEGLMEKNAAVDVGQLIEGLKNHPAIQTILSNLAQGGTGGGIVGGLGGGALGLILSLLTGKNPLAGLLAGGGLGAGLGAFGRSGYDAYKHYQGAQEGKRLTAPENAQRLAAKAQLDQANMDELGQDFANARQDINNLVDQSAIDAQMAPQQNPQSDFSDVSQGILPKFDTTLGSNQTANVPDIEEESILRQQDEYQKQLAAYNVRMKALESMKNRVMNNELPVTAPTYSDYTNAAGIIPGTIGYYADTTKGMVDKAREFNNEMGQVAQRGVDKVVDTAHKGVNNTVDFAKNTANAVGQTARQTYDVLFKGQGRPVTSQNSDELLKSLDSISQKIQPPTPPPASKYAPAPQPAPQPQVNQNPVPAPAQQNQPQYKVPQFLKR